MSSMPRSVALLGVGAALTMACTAFVAPSGQGRLRAARTQPQVDFGTSTSSAGSTGLWTACSMGGALLAVGAAVTRRAAKAPVEVVAEAIPRPEDLLDSPKFPMFEGSTGGYMSRSTR
ncbi:psaD, partial [Symbiodinium sp. CCMP2456]